MASKSGYIGRSPGDDGVLISRQTFTPTSDTTTFAFTSLYTPGYIDVYLNGAKLIDRSDYTATDGSNVILTTAAAAGDILECVAYKNFNVVDTTTNNVTSIIAGDNISIDQSTGDVTITGLANTAHVVADSLVVSGVSTLSSATFSDNISGTTASFSGNVSIAGTLTYEDVTNIDSVGLITARSGIVVTGGEILVGSAFSVGQVGVVTATGVDVTGNVSVSSSVTANKFFGDGSGLTNLPISSSPRIIAFSPEALTTGNSVSTNITITFDQDIKFNGTGDIVLRSGSSSGTAITTFTITNGTPSSGISTAGTQLIINPAEDFDTDTNVFVILPSSGISNGGGDAYDGSDTYNFRTEVATFTLEGGNEAFNISDSNSPTGVYRYHVFSSSGIMTASSAFSQADDFTMFAIGGGGGSIIVAEPSSGGGSGGGGAGGYVMRTGPTMGLAAGTYTVTIGAGGAGGYVPLSAGQYQTSVPSDAWDGQGGDTTITAPTSPSVYLIRAYGGGRGAIQKIEPSYPPANPTQPSDPLRHGQPGGSGGGAAGGATSPTYIPTGGTSLFSQGNAGGQGWTYTETLANPLNPTFPYSAPSPAVLPQGTDFVCGCGGGGAGGTGEGYNAYLANPTSPNIRYQQLYLAGNGGIGTAISSTFPGTEIIPRITTIPSDSLTEYGASSRIGGGGGGGVMQYAGPSFPVGPSGTVNPAPTATYFPESVQDSWPKNGTGGTGGGGDGAIYLAGDPGRGYSPYRQNQAGFTNLGGGAGGGSKHKDINDRIDGKNGGSGVVFIRYATPSL